jgi:hypothetical protein
MENTLVVRFGNGGLFAGRRDYDTGEKHSNNCTCDNPDRLNHY